tara:strand:+ start:19591 stop:20205 length:615 start_codon:yes stop_codon:yes gene_type:complete
LNILKKYRISFTILNMDSKRIYKFFDSFDRRSSIVNIVVTTLVYIASNNSFIKKYPEINFFFDYIFVVLITYVLDIFFVQQNFNTSRGIRKLSYNNFEDRFNSLFDNDNLYKLLIVIGITTIFNKSIFDYVKNILDKKNIFTKKNQIENRNLLLKISISAFSTILFVNTLKFNWVYIDTSNITLKMVVLSWFATGILISVNYYK